MHTRIGRSLPGVDARPAILLVEDDVLRRMATAEDLRAAGFLVLEAANADEAMMVLRGPTQVDAVMTDIRMPGSMDGVHLAEAVRTCWPHLKIFVISVDAPGWPARMLIDAFFGKPVDPARLISRIRQFFPQYQT